MTALELLQKAHFTRQFPSSVLAKLAALARVIEWNEQDLIFREGDVQQNLYVISSGHVALEMNLPGHQLQQLCQSDAEVGFHLMWQVASALSQRLVATRLQLLDLFAKPH
ncbi:MAG: hypothetical protein FD138_2777 [Planctomycetota bacterium]|nr:MAG: hypothetical protein FD138_2777 [Planctomycetota bacterium]